jgi:hypothetical protein
MKKSQRTQRAGTRAARVGIYVKPDFAKPANKTVDADVCDKCGKKAGILFSLKHGMGCITCRTRELP